MKECTQSYGKWKKGDKFDLTEVEGCHAYCNFHYSYAGDKTVCTESCSDVYGRKSDARQCKKGCRDFPLNNEHIWSLPPMSPVYQPPPSRQVVLQNKDGSQTTGQIIHEGENGYVQIQTSEGRVEGFISGGTFRQRD
jgi:hypothetical protein